METSVRSVIGATIFSFKGAFDTVSAGPVEKSVKEVLASGQKNLIFDLTDVPYIASSGLRVLMMALKGTRAAQGDARLAGVFRTVREVMKMTGLDSQFPIYPNVSAALEKFAMDVSDTVVDDVLVVNLRGDIEPAVAPLLLSHLRTLFSRAPGRAVLNMAGVNYASIEGLRALREAKKAAADLGVELRLAGVERALKEAFDLKGVTSQFQIFPKADAAVASFPRR